MIFNINGDIYCAQYLKFFPLFFLFNRAPEPQILDYQAQQNKLFPPLAATFAFHFVADHLWSLYGTANESIAGGDLQLLPDVKN